MKKIKYSKISVSNSYDNTIAQMPKYNGYQTGHGAWKTAKHPSRAKTKDMIRKRKDDSYDY